MALKGYRLWVMVQLDSTCRAPPRVLRGEIDHDDLLVVVANLDVAVQVKFESKGLKPGYHNSEEKQSAATYPRYRPDKSGIYLRFKG
jgi:hypothetical protein